MSRTLDRSRGGRIGTVRFPGGIPALPVAPLARWHAMVGRNGAGHNDQVATWDDQSGNGYHVTKTGANGAVFKNGVLGTKAGLEFDRTLSMSYDMPAGLRTAMEGKTDLTFAVVGKWTTGASSSALRRTTFYFHDATSASLYLHRRTDADDDMLFFLRDGPSGAADFNCREASPSDANPHLFLGYSDSTENAFLRKDGGQIATDADANWNNGSQLESLSFGRIGNSDLDSSYMDGVLSELIFWNTTMTAAQRSNIESILGTYWNVP